MCAVRAGSIRKLLYPFIMRNHRSSFLLTNLFLFAAHWSLCCTILLLFHHCFNSLAYFSFQFNSTQFFTNPFCNCKTQSSSQFKRTKVFLITIINSLNAKKCSKIWKRRMKYFQIKLVVPLLFRITLTLCTEREFNEFIEATEVHSTWMLLHAMAMRKKRAAHK